MEKVGKIIIHGIVSGTPQERPNTMITIGNEKLAMVYGDRIDIVESRARLLANSWDLLDALNNLVQRVQYMDSVEKEVKKAKQAISKATGV